MHTSDRAGLLYVLAGFSLLSVGDAIVKGMAGMWPAPAMIGIRYLVGSALLAFLLARREGAGALVIPRSGLQWVRGIAISCSAMGMWFAVWIMPLAEATTIGFTQPMITALLAIMLLREPSHRSTWIAIAVAFVGVVIVLRPNFQDVGFGALLPLLSATGMAVTIIANRAMAGKASVLVAQYWMSITALIFLVVVSLVGHVSDLEAFRLDWPHWSVIARCTFLGFSATLGQYLIYMGTVKAGPATVAPMTYGQLLVAVVLGWLFFSEAPDATALIGAAVIVGAGLYLWYVSRPPKVEEVVQ